MSSKAKRRAGRTLLACLISLLTCVAPRVTARAGAESISNIGTNQRVLVICVKYSDVATTRRPNANDWVTLLTNETNTFYNRATFNQTNFNFQTTAGGPADGWHSLGYPGADYGFFKTGQDAINLADPFVDFSQYNRVLVITNWQGFGGQGGGPWGWAVNEGVEYMENGAGKRLMTLAIVNEWLANSFGNPFDEAGSVAAHEIGHQLGLPTHYADVRFFPGVTRDVVSPWDIMGYSPTLNHFVGWAKGERNWVPAARVQAVGPPVGSNIDTTITLRPLETNTGGTQLIKIPFTTAGPFSGYVIENRRQINGDERLPSQGVLVSLVDESPNTILKEIVMDDPASPGDMSQAPLDVGGVFGDAGRNLTVTVLSRSGDNYSVRVQYQLPAAARPDPMIIPWGAPPWETADIWIDSEKNGFGTYRYTDGAGNPTGNGDDAWVNHSNRVNVRLRNIGPGTATNVRVQVFVNSPPGMGDAGPNWDYLGTIIIPSISAGGTAQDFVNWTPSVGAHTCIKAVIDNTPGELSTSNNAAQENVSAFDTSAGSPYQPVGLAINVFNPFPHKTPVHMSVRDVPKGWAVLIEPTDFVLQPGGKDSVRFMVFPSGMPGAKTPPEFRKYLDQYRPGFIGRPKLEAQVPYADTYIPIGGVDVWTHLTNRTDLTCAAGEKQVEPPKPPVGTQVPPPTVGLMPKGGVRKGVALKTADLAALAELGAMVRRTPPPPGFREGQTLVWYGRLSPAFAGAVIAVEFTSGKTRTVLFTKTDAEGRYVVRFAPTSPGLWSVQAYFAGDATHQAADSNPCPVVVGKEGEYKRQ